MSDVELNKLSPEAELAMKTALSVLENEKRSSKKVAAIEESRPAEDRTTNSAPSPVEQVVAGVEPQHLTGVRLISRRDEIPISEKHVLVMWGLSTYRFEHPLGVTFTVNNSRSNAARDQQHLEAQRAARELARAQGLPFIYVLR